MKFVVSSSALLGHLQIVGRVISNKTTLPILNSLLFKIEGNSLEVTASDLETRLSTKIALDNISGEGTIAIPNKILTDMLKEFSEQPLTFEIDETTQRVTINSENGQYNIVGQSADEYPSTLQMGGEDEVSVSLPAEVLLNGITRTIFAAGDDEMRPVVNGLFFDLMDSNSLTIAATDGTKLARYRRTDVSEHAMGSFILPKKPANLLKVLVGRESGDVSITFNQRVAQINMTDYTLVCRLAEGKYPNYNAAIPNNTPNVMIIDRMDIYSTIRRVSHFANAATNQIKFAIANNQCEISARDDDYAQSGQELLPCEFTGDAIQIGFKANDMLEILSNLSSLHISARMSDATHACLYEPHEKDEPNEDILMLIMPVGL